MSAHALAVRVRFVQVAHTTPANIGVLGIVAYVVTPMPTAFTLFMC
jgi:hypothetical protein